MIGISKLYFGTIEPSDPLRYGRQSGKLPSHLLQFAGDKKPVVVWNVSRRCNLDCIHCYAGARNQACDGELSTAAGKSLLNDLAAFGVPVVLFSGGEPLMRPDILELIGTARELGMRAVLSTNGTLIDTSLARELKKLDLSYVGVSLDGLEAVHDRFRKVPGAFGKAMAGLRNCRDAGVKVGLRFTISRHNSTEIPGVFQLLRRERIARACFYHLVYSGRGSKMMDDDLSHEQTRYVLDQLIDLTGQLFKEGHKPEVLTVANHADGVYLYKRLLREEPQRAAAVLQLLRMNGGNSSGHGIGCVSWDGSVHADQFWHQHCFGNVRERPFGEIWSDLGNPMMAQLKEKKRHVKGRCAACEYLALCGGNFRARAEAVTGDPWAADPACYLTDDEIRLNKPMSAAGKRFFEESSGTKTLPNTPSTLRNPA